MQVTAHSLLTDNYSTYIVKEGKHVLTGSKKKTAVLTTICSPPKSCNIKIDIQCIGVTEVCGIRRCLNGCIDAEQAKGHCCKIVPDTLDTMLHGKSRE